MATKDSHNAKHGKKQEPKNDQLIEFLSSPNIEDKLWEFFIDKSISDKRHPLIFEGGENEDDFSIINCIDGLLLAIDKVVKGEDLCTNESMNEIHKSLYQMSGGFKDSVSYEIYDHESFMFVINANRNIHENIDDMLRLVFGGEEGQKYGYYEQTKIIQKSTPEEKTWLTYFPKIGKIFEYHASKYKEYLELGITSDSVNGVDTDMQNFEKIYFPTWSKYLKSDHFIKLNPQDKAYMISLLSSGLIYFHPWENGNTRMVEINLLAKCLQEKLIPILTNNPGMFPYYSDIHNCGTQEEPFKTLTDVIREGQKNYESLLSIDITTDVNYQKFLKPYAYVAAKLKNTGSEDPERWNKLQSLYDVEQGKHQIPQPQ